MSEAVEEAFGGDADYAMLHKIYGASGEPDTRYSPLQIGTDPLPERARASRSANASFSEATSVLDRSFCVEQEIVVERQSQGLQMRLTRFDLQYKGVLPI